MKRVPSLRGRVLAPFLVVLLCLAVALYFVAPTVPPPSGGAAGGEILVEFLDVGQGDAILIRSPEDKVALVDAGPAKDEVLKLLKKRGIQKIDLVVASHHHADHIGGMSVVVQAYEPTVFLESGTGHTSMTYKRLLDAVKNAATRVVYPRPDMERKINLGSVLIRVFPQPPEDETEENNNSLGLRVEYQNFSVLLTGDSEEAERAWWRKHIDNHLFHNVTILKVAHHGSRNGINRSWLRAAKPKLAIISCGKNNKYGHPHQEALDLLKDEGVPLKRTDEDGTITIQSDGQKWKTVNEADVPKRRSAALPLPKQTSRSHPLPAYEYNYAPVRRERRELGVCQQTRKRAAGRGVPGGFTDGHLAEPGPDARWSNTSIALSFLRPRSATVCRCTKKSVLSTESACADAAASSDGTACLPLVRQAGAYRHLT